MQSISRLAPFMCIAATLATPFLRPPPTLLASGEFYALCARVELTEAVVLRVLCPNILVYCRKENVKAPTSPEAVVDSSFMLLYLRKKPLSI